MMQPPWFAGPTLAMNSCHLPVADFLLGLLFDHEDGGDTFLRHLGGLLPKLHGFTTDNHSCENLKSSLTGSVFFVSLL
jgi:hypothetical protein